MSLHSGHPTFTTPEPSKSPALERSSSRSLTAKPTGTRLTDGIELEDEDVLVLCDFAQQRFGVRAVPFEQTSTPQKSSTAAYAPLSSRNGVPPAPRPAHSHVRCTAQHGTALHRTSARPPNAQRRGRAVTRLHSPLATSLSAFLSPSPLPSPFLSFPPFPLSLSPSPLSLLPSSCAIARSPCLTRTLSC